jgi:glycosyltransferase involved in cell wall biosynthesis
MDLIFVCEARFSRSVEGKVFSLDGVFNQEIFTRYLDVFDNVKVVGRMFDTNRVVSKEFYLENSQIQFLPVFGYDGPLGYFFNRGKVRKQIKAYIELGGAVIVRVPGILGFETADICDELLINYGVEVVGDPYDVFSKASFKHPLRRFLKYYFTKNLKKTVKGAVAGLFVTSTTLQERYPVTGGVLAVSASNVAIYGGDIAKQPYRFQKRDKYVIVSIGSLNQLYKSPDVLIKCVAALKDMHIDVSLKWLGDGKYLTEMQGLVKDLNVEDRVFFLGNLPKKEVFAVLKSADLFALVSRTEGLPRAMIEAMATGLPVVGSNVGGIPELISSAALVDKNDVDGLVKMIEKMLTDEGFTNSLAKHNLIKAHEFENVLLQEKRVMFYKELIKLS